MVTAATLSALSGRTIDADRAAAVIATVTSRAKSYTRGKGWVDDIPADDLQTVIATASLRMLSNPTGLQGETMGPFQLTYGREFLGWTVGETLVLNRYRDRAK